MSEVPISGFCDPKFEPVRRAFEQNFAERDEVGAAVAVVIGGEPVIDLWGGWADGARTHPWERDTIVAVWSLGKTVTAVGLLRLVERGLVELDAPVARYWPEFAQAGKQHLPVRYLLSHQAGLPAVAKPLPPGFNLTDWDGMVEALAAQGPWWEPGTRFGYHVNTHGFLAGEVIRRVDGRRISRFLAEEIAIPMGIDHHFGTAPEDDARTAEWLPYVAPPGAEPQRAFLQQDPARLSGVELARVLAYRNPPSLPEAGPNSRLWRAAEFPSTNSHSNARSLARFFGGLVNGGTVDGHHLLAPELVAEASRIHADGEDAVLGRPNRFGLGFQLTIPGVRPLGPNPGTFGHYGNGAHLGFGDPVTGVGFGYTLNRSGTSWRDPRNIALVDALYSCL